MSPHRPRKRSIFSYLLPTRHRQRKHPNHCSCNLQDASLDSLTQLPPYKYRPLKTPRSVRIFELLPGKGADPIRGRLTQVELDSEVDAYKALSYAWGDTNKPHLVDCDGSSIQITCNLFSALSRFRDADEQRSLSLFVDGLCINQSEEAASLREREAQVKLMNRIFGLAECVIIDLGDRIDDAPAVSTFLAKLTSIPAMEWEEIREDPTKGDEVGLPSIQDSVWDSLASLCSCRWLTRLWVVQEFALAKETMVTFGPKRLIVSHEVLFWGIVRAYQLHNVLSRQDPLLTVPTSEAEAMDRHVNAGFRVSQATTKLAQLRSAREAFDGSQTSDTSGQATLADLLESTWTFSTTDSRDRVYALLGMVRPEDVSALRVDYSESVQQLSRRVSKLLVGDGQVAELLYCLASFDGRGLSSWMLNLESRKERDSIDLQGTPERQEYEPKAFHATRGTAITYTFETTSHSLVLSGHIADEIVWISRQFPTLPDSQKPKWPARNSVMIQFEWENEVFQMASEHVRRHMSQGDFSTAFRTTLVAGGRLFYGDTFGIHPIVNDLPTCIAIREYAVQGPDASWAGAPSWWTDEVVGAKMLNYHSHLVSACEGGRRLCVTRKGRMGLVPSETCSGDVILFVLGGPLPFVARKTPTAHKLIGRAYVHGLMDGEVLELDDWKLEDIVLD